MLSNIRAFCWKARITEECEDFMFSSKLKDREGMNMIESILLTFLWLFRTEGVTKALSQRSHLYFLCPSCTTWIWTFKVSFLLKVASQWSHLKVLSPYTRRKQSLKILVFWWKYANAYCFRKINKSNKDKQKAEPWGQKENDYHIR